MTRRDHAPPASKSDAGEHGRRQRSAAFIVATAVLAALLLGAFALVADAMTGSLARLLLLVSSTGLAWGVAAFVLGAMAPRPPVAAVAGAIVMLGSVGTYYGGAALFGLRPTAGAASLLAAARVWGALAAVAGPILGLVGWYATRTEGRVRSVIWGVLGGLILSQGLHLMPRTWEGLVDPSTRPLWPLLFAAIVIPLVLVVVGSRRRHMLAVFSVMVPVAVLGAAAWSFVLRVV